MKKKYILSLFCILICNCVLAQTLTQKLYYTNKLWGFVKYYHSNVSVCNVNWDSVLLRVLPLVRSAATNDQFNDALDTMLAAAGPMAISTVPFPDVIAPELKRNRDFSWMGSPVLRTDVMVQLDTIKNNFRPHTQCWVKKNDFSTSYYGWLVFPYDDPQLDVNTTANFPDADHRMLMFIKYWTLVRYFNPYNYASDTSWDSVFTKYVPEIETVATPLALYHTINKIATNINDIHAEGYTYSSYLLHPPGYYQPALRLGFVDNKYVVLESHEPGIYAGDGIVTIDGLTTGQWEDSLRPYISAGNISIFRRQISETILGRQSIHTPETLVIEDSLGTNHTYNMFADSTRYSIYYRNRYYPADSLVNIKYTSMNCDVGYVNMGNLRISDVSPMYISFKEKSAIIFDLRNYPNSTLWSLADLLLPNRTAFARNMEPDIFYPGTYHWVDDSIGQNGNSISYKGQVIVLINEQAQSQAEYTAMMLRAMPNVTVIGSQTAGADGNITYWGITQDIFSGISSLGVFYPNGDSTQRIGIVPNSFVLPTQFGIRHHNDEVLNMALNVACSTAAINEINNKTEIVNIYPNPANDVITISYKYDRPTDFLISISDILGRTLITNQNTNHGQPINLDIHSLEKGIYFVTLKTETTRHFIKFLKN